jgi:hypothetical protein
MRFKSAFLSVVLVLGAVSAQAHVPDYAITLDALDGKPFASGNYGLGGSGRFEMRPIDWAAFGFGLHYLGIQAPGGVLDTFTGADLSFRWLPFSTRYVEPYVLFGVGYDYLDDTTKDKGDNHGFFGQGGLGFQFPFSRSWALEAGMDYQARTTVNLPNTAIIRAGLQYRFDFEPTPEPTPIVSQLRPKTVKASVLANGDTLSLKVPTNIPDAELKSWKIEVVTPYDRTLKVLEGVGPLPKEMDLKDLAGYDDLRFISHLVANDDSEEYGSGKVVRGAVAEEPEPVPTPAAPVEVDEVVVTSKATLWTVAARPEIYDDPFLYYLIFDANQDKLKDPDFLPLGLKLKIPHQFTPKQRSDALKRAWAHQEGGASSDAPAAAAK